MKRFKSNSPIIFRDIQNNLRQYIDFFIKMSQGQTSW